MALLADDGGDELPAEDLVDARVVGVAPQRLQQTSSFQSMRVAYSDHSSNPVCRLLRYLGFSMMEQVRLCTVWPQENWLGTSKTTYRVG